MKILVYVLLITLLSFSVALKVHSAEKGDEAISIPLKLLENNKPGKTVYLDFWASWCGPCRKSLPILNEIRSQYSSQGFEVIAVNIDEKLADALRFLDKYPVDYPIFLDPKGKLPKAYKVPGMPTAYLIDEKGTIIYKHVGFKTKDRKKIEKLISEHIAKR
jgi:thiol-disulfide isomerase/thioredoxin